MTARLHTPRSAAPRLGPAVIAAVLAVSFAAIGGAGSAQAADGLTIAILDLAEVPDLAPPKPLRAEPSAWRTSFGSERKNAPNVKPASPDSPLEAIANADAVLIQGVHAAAKLRRLFPPRTWRLIVSRGLADASRAANIGAGTTTTAIAIKARPELRVTARTAGFRLEAPDAQAPPGAPQTTATAVRLVDAGRAIWLASVAFPVGCSEASDCPARQQLNTWRETKRGDGELTVIGGRTQVEHAAPAPTAENAPPCAAHGIDADSPWQRVPLPSAENPQKSASGCIAMIRLDGPSAVR
ncbi:hypothetical protein [Hyphomicrobium sp.]|uniref:hypothetical protein n=1 Tax=Hyphomicrobium sp. TaxID=82 RepID=UPI003F6FB81B